MFSEFISENLFLVAAFVISANLWLWSLVRGNVAGVNTISTLQLPALQRGGKYQIFDVSEKEVFDKSHIPEASHLTLEQVNENNKSLMKLKDKKVILVCQTGATSSKAAKKLVTLGFSNINLLRGGMLSWQKENLPTAST